MPAEPFIQYEGGSAKFAIRNAEKEAALFPLLWGCCSVVGASRVASRKECTLGRCSDVNAKAQVIYSRLPGIVLYRVIAITR